MTVGERGEPFFVDLIKKCTHDRSRWQIGSKFTLSITISDVRVKALRKKVTTSCIKSINIL